MDDEKYIFSNSDLTIWQKEIKNIKKIDLKTNLDTQDSFNKRFEVKKLTQNKYNFNLTQNSKKINVIKFGDQSNLNRKLRSNIAKGIIIVDAELDLHGCSTNNAYNKLINFLNDSISQGYRKLLIITGKGVNSPNKVSIIKKNFFDWIQTWEMQANLLYIDYAHKKHGGDGAFYGFLKKQSYENIVD
ncbi:Smr/MutS family protein [Candidatus Aquarickettsia rohweri]|uniref:Smr domain-containing protein n=1 Tax=Candidatus Aquarickettsia rohweri TaxID=2602574 RepID=A0A429XUB4_9RICK|nr:Smr/MutS family protein [Candidatus Aquarickettsia rohweri]RST71554.1 hypothetical protein EIC27_00750 [Candidatus Aquarickettsia rohweri]